MLVVVALLLCSAHSWEVKSLADRDAPFSFYIALRHDATKLLELRERVQAITDPISPSFGQYLQKAEVMSLLMHDHASSVTLFVKRRCPGSVVHNRGDSIAVHANVECATSLFSVKLTAFVHRETNAFGIALAPSSGSVVVPAAIAPHVDMVVGIAGPSMLRVPRQRKMRAEDVDASAVVSGDNVTYEFISIEEINRVYKVATNKIVNPTKATSAIIEFATIYNPGNQSGEGAPSLIDLETFSNYSGIPFSNVSSIVGPWVQSADLDSGESELDVQMLTAVAQTPFTYVTVNVSWVFGMATELFNLEHTPTVTSVSYGTDEGQQCNFGDCSASPQNVRAYIDRCEIEMMKLAAVGAAVVISSGDQGAPGRENADCSLDNTTNAINPSYPGSSAWATSVSGTTLQTVNATLPPFNSSLPICQPFPCATQGNIEIPCMAPSTYYNWTTGGGFSRNVPAPLFQQEFVNEYLRDGSVVFPPSTLFSPSFRAYPDIAAFGSRILIVTSGNVSVTAGTSASAPIVAGLFTLLNDARVSAGKSPIGFWNPVLYLAKSKCPQCFNVITTGANNCGQPNCCKFGYQVGTQSRFNTVTGLGSLNIAAMLPFVLSLP